ELESRPEVPARGNQELGTRPEVPTEVGPSQDQPRARRRSQELGTRPEVPARGNQELGTRPEVSAEVGLSQHYPSARISAHRHSRRLCLRWCLQILKTIRWGSLHSRPTPGQQWRGHATFRWKGGGDRVDLYHLDETWDVAH
ncbi:unnamed protein product, partial [Laminaria digitata]